MSTDYKILYVLSTLGQGGAEKQLYYLIKYLKPHATVVSLSGSGYWEEHLLELGVQVIALQRKRKADFRRLFELVRIIHTGNYDIIHLFIDNVSGIYAHLAVLLSGHRCFVTGERVSIFTNPRWYRCFKRIANRNVRVVCCNTQSEVKELLHAGLVRADKIRLIPNGIELERYFPGYRKNTSITIGTIGRLVAQKNPIMYVQVAAKVINQSPSVRFVHVGKGELHNETHKLVRQLGIENNFEFYGSRDDIAEVLQKIDVFALTSNAEGMPNVLMEAMASGIPSVVTDVGNCSELITHGENGFIVPPGDISQFVDSLLILIHDESLRHRMGQKSYERIRAFDASQMAEKYARVYVEVLRSSR